MAEEMLSKEIQEKLTIKLLGKAFIKLEHKDGKLVPTTFYEYEGKTYHFDEDK